MIHWDSHSDDTLPIHVENLQQLFYTFDKYADPLGCVYHGHRGQFPSVCGTIPHYNLAGDLPWLHLFFT